MIIPTTHWAVRICVRLMLMKFLYGVSVVGQRTGPSTLGRGSQFFEGDITGIDPAAIESGLSRKSSKNGIIDELKHWPNGKVPYIIGEGFSVPQQFLLIRAMDDFSGQTCIVFAPRVEEAQYLNIQPLLKDISACGSSALGRQQEMQFVYISTNPDCMGKGVIQHELMHAVGFFHEQARTDRDDYVEINFNNIADSEWTQFQKYDAKYVTAYGFPYDFGSVMHYTRTAFAIDPSSWTIRPRAQYRREFESKVGQRIGLSPLDIGKINAMYKCPQEGISKPPVELHSLPSTTTETSTTPDEVTDEQKEKDLHLQTTTETITTRKRTKQRKSIPTRTRNRILETDSTTTCEDQPESGGLICTNCTTLEPGGRSSWRTECQPVGQAMAHRPDSPNNVATTQSALIGDEPCTVTIDTRGQTCTRCTTVVGFRSSWTEQCQPRGVNQLHTSRLPGLKSRATKPVSSPEASTENSCYEVVKGGQTCTHCSFNENGRTRWNEQCRW